MALEKARMRQPMIATPAPTQNSTQLGPGLEIGKAMPPIVNPMMVTTVPTQEMGLPELCSEWAVPCSSTPAVPVLSTVPVACSVTTPPSTHGLPMLRLTRKYRKRDRDSVAGPHLAYDDTNASPLVHPLSTVARSTTRSAFDPR